MHSTETTVKKHSAKGKGILNIKRTSFHTFVLLILFLAIFLPSTLFAQHDPYVELRDQAHILATTIAEDLEVFSIQYALMSKGEIILSGNVSNSQYLPPEPYDNDTVYGIGSISKMFSTAAIMQLVDQEILDLDEPITTYLPEFFMQDQRYLEITVRMLLNHSSGLLGSYMMNGITYDDPNTFNRENMLSELRNQPLKADPGAYSVYCNDGFTLIELIIERVSGLSYSEYIRKNIAVPLTMTNTCTPENNPNLEKLARTYHDEKVTPPETFNLIATGGVYSTAENLCQFGHIFMDNPGSDSMQEFLSDQAKQSLRNKEYDLGMWPNQEANMYGFGLGWDSVDLYPFDQYGIQALVKGGDTFLYHGSIIVLPEYDLVFAALLSGGSSIFGLMMGQELLLHILLANGDIETKLPPYEIASYDRVAIPSELYAYEGLYANTSFINKISINTDGTLLSTNLNEKDTTEELFWYTTGGVFINESQNKQLSFFTEENGRTYTHVVRILEIPNVGHTVMTYYEHERLELQKVDPEVQKSWDSRSGSWYYAVNEIPTSQYYHLMLIIRMWLSTHDDLPGFVGSQRIIDQHSAMHDVQIPILNERDNQLTRVIYSHGKEYLVSEGTVYISERDMQNLHPGGIALVGIQHDGYARWFKTDSNHAGKSLTVVLPNNGAFAVYDENECVFFSTVDGNIPVILPDNGKVVFVGTAPGDQFLISVR